MFGNFITQRTQITFPIALLDTLKEQIYVSTYLFYVSPLHRHCIVSEMLYNIQLCKTIHYSFLFDELEPPPPRSPPWGAYRVMAATSEFLLQCVNLEKCTLFLHLPCHTLLICHQVEVWWLSMLWPSTHTVLPVALSKKKHEKKTTTFPKKNKPTISVKKALFYIIIDLKGVINFITQNISFQHVYNY